MFKFFRNLFKKKTKKKICIDGMEITIDKKKGQMTIVTNKKLTEGQIREIFEKYVLGE